MKPKPKKHFWYERGRAQAAGKKWYFTGRPCRHHHVAERQVSNRTCGACLRRSDGQPKKPVYHPVLLASWIDPNSTDPRRVEHALRIIMKRTARWVQYQGAAQFAHRHGIRRGQHVDGLARVNLPEDFYGTDGLPLTGRQYLLGPWFVDDGA